MVWRYTHTCTHNTNTPARLRVAGSRGKKTPAQIVSKTTLAAELAEGKPFGPKLAPATCQAGACSRPSWGSRGSPDSTAGARELCQPFPGGCPPTGLQKAGERVPGMEIPRETALTGTGGFAFPSARELQILSYKRPWGRQHLQWDWGGWGWAALPLAAATG